MDSLDSGAGPVGELWDGSLALKQVSIDSSESASWVEVEDSGPTDLLLTDLEVNRQLKRVGRKIPSIRNLSRVRRSRDVYTSLHVREWGVGHFVN